MSISDQNSPRTRLLAASETRFRRFGYKRTTVDEIANEAGTGKGSVYLHFSSKQEIYLAVVEESLERFIAKAERVLATKDPVPTRLRALVELTAEHYGADELLHASLFGETDLVEGDVARLAEQRQRKRIGELLENVLVTGQAEGSIRSSLDPASVAGVLFEIGWTIVRAGLESADPSHLATSLDVLNDIVGLGIIPRPSR